jgi:hypothetical protein
MKTIEKMVNNYNARNLITEPSHRKVTAVGLLLLVAATSGCGSIAGSVAREILYGNEHSEDRSFCEKSCSERTGDAYSVCYTECMSLQRRKRREEKSEREQAETLRNLMAPKNR